MREVDALFRQTVQMGHNVLASSDIFGKDTSATLQQYHDDVGSLGFEQGVRCCAVCEIKTIHCLCPFCLAHKLIIGHVTGGLLE